MEQLDTREKLWKLESEALKKSEEVNNPYWIMCYKNLAMAISTLDAFMARSSEGIKELTEDNKDTNLAKLKGWYCR
jgi:hypothetical protein